MFKRFTPRATFLIGATIFTVSVGAALAQDLSHSGLAPARHSNAAQKPAQDAAVPQQRTLTDRVNAAIGLEGSTVVPLTIEQTEGPGLRTIIPIDGQPATLVLTRHSVRSDQYEVLAQQADGSLVPVDPSPVNTYRGGVEEWPEAVASAGMMADGLHAMVLMPDDNRLWVQPISRFIPDADPSLHVVYRDADVICPGGTCGTADAVLMDDHAGLGAEGQQRSQSQPLGTIVCAQLGCDADFEYFVHWGSVSAVENRINLIINNVNNQYEGQVLIRHLITTIIVRTAEPDPYSSSDPGVLLSQFRAEWLNNQGGVPRDVAHLFTDKNLAGSVIGIAWGIGQICNINGHYCLSQSDFNGSFSCATDLTAHELGHLWNAVHCSCPSFTMNPSITCANQFSSGSIADISQHRDSRTCLSDCSPANDICAAAAVIQEGITAFNNDFATTTGPDESPFCDLAGQIDNDLWYKFVSPCTGILDISLCTTFFNTRLAVYGAICPSGPGEALACNDDSCGTRSALSMPVVQGQVYRIRIGGANGATGNGNISLTCTPGLPCPGDFNGDTVIDVLDLLDLLAAWGPCAGCVPDLNGDDVVDVLDLLELLAGWGPCP